MRILKISEFILDRLNIYHRLCSILYFLLTAPDPEHHSGGRGASENFKIDDLSFVTNGTSSQFFLTSGEGGIAFSASPNLSNI